MSLAAAPVSRPGFFRVVLGWFADVFAVRSSEPSQKAAEAAAHVSVLFRPWSAGASYRTSRSQLSANIDNARARLLSARLKSVAVENVQSGRAPKRRPSTAPRGKSIPVSQPKVLKRYRTSAQPPVLSARLRILKLTTLRPTNVIELTRALKAMRRDVVETFKMREVA